MLSWAYFLKLVIVMGVWFIWFSLDVGYASQGMSQVIRLREEGELYEIVERDALEEIEERAKKLRVNLWERIEAGIRKKLEPRFDFQKACHNRTYEFVRYYRLPFDIKVNGTVLYPMGYTFNPLEYIHPVIESYEIVFFDGSSQVELEWLERRSGLNLGSPRVILIVVKGNVVELVKRLRRPVYVYDPVIMDEAFRIKATPSVVRFRGGKVIVTEVGIHKCR